MASTAIRIAQGPLVPIDADAELGNADLEASANIARFLAGAMVGLGHARERADRWVNGLHGVVGTAAAAATVALTKTWLHGVVTSGWLHIPAWGGQREYEGNEERGERGARDKGQG